MVSAAAIAHDAAVNGETIEVWAETFSVLSWQRLAMLVPLILAVLSISHAFIRGHTAVPAGSQTLGELRILFHLAPIRLLFTLCR
jgi:hypothetical protein